MRGEGEGRFVCPCVSLFHVGRHGGCQELEQPWELVLVDQEKSGSKHCLKRRMLAEFHFCSMSSSAEGPNKCTFEARPM